MRSPLTLFSDAWMLFARHAVLFVSIYLIPTVLFVIYTFFILLFSSPDLDPVLRQVALPFNLVLTFMLIIVSILAVIALIRAVSSPESTTLASAYKFGLENLLSYIWLALLTGAAVMVGFLFLIIPGILFLVWFVFVYYILVLEGVKGVDAMKASKAYVKGYWWPIFGRIFLFMLLVVIVSKGFGVLAHSVFGEGQLFIDVIESAIGVVLVPFYITYMYLLYTDIKKVKAGDVSEPDKNNAMQTE